MQLRDAHAKHVAPWQAGASRLQRSRGTSVGAAASNSRRAIASAASTNDEILPVYGGQCTLCGGFHWLPCTTEAAAHARGLVDTVHQRWRLDYESATPDPRFSLDWLYTKGPGRMLGVLLAVDDNGKQHVLKAFSGQITESWIIPGWVGPVAGIINTSPVYVEARQAIEQLSAQLHELDAAVVKSQLELSQHGVEQKQQLTQSVHSDAGQLHNQYQQQQPPARLPGIEQQQQLGIGPMAADHQQQQQQQQQQHHKQQLGGSYAAPQQEQPARTDDVDHVQQQQRQQQRSMQQQQQCSTTAHPHGVNHSQPRSTQFITQQRQLLKKHRKALSHSLLQQIQLSYQTKTISLTSISLLDVYLDFVQHYDPTLPVTKVGGFTGFPAGVGDCCAPKLLHAAVVRGFRPVALAEVWCGSAPGTATKAKLGRPIVLGNDGASRQHMEFYGMCDKCKAVLGTMLCGVGGLEGMCCENN